MKKLLFASTALVASTGFAAAQSIDLSGEAEMGIFGGDGIDTQFHSDIDVRFSMAGETDAGLTFGAQIDLDESDTDRTIPGTAVDIDEGSITITEDENGNPIATGGTVSTQNIAVGGSPAFDNDTQGGESIFVSGSLGTLTMGDTDGAFDRVLEEAIIGSALNDDHEHAGYNGNAGLDGLYDGQIATYEYTFGDFTVVASAEIDDNPDDNFDTSVFDDEDFTDQIQDEIDLRAQRIDNDTVLGLGARYSGSFGMFDFGVGAGYQRAGMETITVDETADPGDRVSTEGMDAEVYGISLDFAMDNGVSAIVNYSEYDNLGGVDYHYGVALGYELGEFVVAANYGKFELDNGGDNDGYGVIANYDLGGGAALQAGYGNSELDGADRTDQFSLGIAMAF